MDYTLTTSQRRVLEEGPSGCSELEVLALQIGGRDAEAVAHALLQRYGDLATLAARPAIELARGVRGFGLVRAIQLKAGIEAGKRCAHGAGLERTQIRTPADAAPIFMLAMGHLEQEEIHVLMLNTRNRVLAREMVYRGQTASCHLRMAEMFKSAIRHNAVAVIFAHNHPGMDPTPGADDLHVTREMIKAGKLLEIDVLDHLVISGRRFCSMRERGLGFD